MPHSLLPRLVLGALLLAGATSHGMGQSQGGYRDYVKAGTYANVRADLEDAIIARGFVIDHLGRFNFMLERTVEAAGTGAALPYVDAEYLQFCPSKLTHDAIAASPFHIANCPITLYVFELKAEAGKVHVGYRLPVGDPSKAVQDVNARLVETLDAIAKDATR